MNHCSAERIWHQQKQSLTDAWTDGRQSDPYGALCYAGAEKSNSIINVIKVKF